MTGESEFDSSYAQSYSPLMNIETDPWGPPKVVWLVPRLMWSGREAVLHIVQRLTNAWSSTSNFALGFVAWCFKLATNRYLLCGNLCTAYKCHGEYRIAWFIEYVNHILFHKEGTKFWELGLVLACRLKVEREGSASTNLSGYKQQLTLWRLTTTIVVVPHRETLNFAFYIFIQQIQVLNILNITYTPRFFLFKMQFVS